MSGKPQYDEAAVIDAALDAFWRHGYAATSINVLTEATGLSRSSLYQRFEDKDGLFQIALSTYTERVLRRMNLATGENAREKIEGMLRGLLPAGARRPPGCLLARSCAELVDLPVAGQEAARAGLNLQREALASLLREGVAAGEFAADADVEALAWHFLGVLQAVLNLPQAGAATKALERMIDIAMLALPISKPKSNKSATAAPREHKKPVRDRR